uniref:Phosphate/phosphite/phosphonate ABC transporter, periplasmic binding protein n=1 Tax=uncultured Alphaproteobacteria bacterium TaxID=91750 RepID=A0A1B0Z290_9PROT|nr:phosphate/phosphite/phosphonate ABC transporter, periplasmic binding protein [uncultured Alphaproteobacteria bacterium]
MIRLGGAASPGYIEVFSGLATYFAKNGLEMDWVLYSSYDTLVEAFERKEIDIAWNGPLSYIKIQRSSVAPAVNVAMRDVDRDYLTHLIVRKDSGITALDETRGKKLALGSRSSVQAGVLPHYYLKELGFQPETDFSEMSFYEERSNVDSNDELDVAWKVVEGEYDAGAISNVALDNFLQNHKQAHNDLNVIWTSPSYSHCCFTAQNDMDTVLRHKITEIFTSVDASNSVGKAILEGESCRSFLPGIEYGWEDLEIAAEKESLL